ncbi:sugar phosphate isomerase/epimerase [Mesorhizobium sp. BAC0120]|uniref:sugar phosphate isomerase/epimerase family protein n=1 Tax=Mesorhizobium sp. BAC0120 TaxID=3090670 RepID=UPI00298C14F0|nr:sugar phosphate isomerase/epimerase [Mesorhizobium sp. BAC0120]MDW6024369.1 sugar phosphate isomerase/epimerase [Mesorhizobium sp. BAC0120]
MKLGIFAKTFAGTDPFDVLSAARQAGYRAVQYNMACSGLGPLPQDIPNDVASKIVEAADENGVEIAAVSATYNMIHPDAARREEGRRSFAAIAAAARRIGTRLVTVCTGSRDPEDQWRHHPDNAMFAAWRDMCAEFELLLPIAEKNDIFLGVEPELANVVNSALQALRLINTFGTNRIRIVLDPANLFEIETPERRHALVQEAVDLLGNAIALAHAKDRHPDGSFATAGKGVLDWDHYLGAVRKAGFEGALVTHGLAADEASAIAAFLAERIRAAEAA